MRKEIKYKIKGMNKDSSFSAFSPEFSFDNRNIRITTIEGNTTLSIVNEKGTKQLEITGDKIYGDVIGNCVISNYLILFTITGDNDDYIYLVTKDQDALTCKVLYDGNNNGNLGFSREALIETLGIYENENNIKVYWVDGINQPRVINIKDSTNLNVNSFDFVPKIDKLGESWLFVQKLYTSGTFPAGVIQYCYTYYNKNKQETNIIEVSPLYYITHLDRGESPNNTVTNSFKLELGKLDTNFQYVRIYSILRTSLDTIPICKVVADLEIPLERKVSIIDTGNLGYTIEPSDLLYIGGEVITAGTITQKDNTLFLGNISVNKLRIEDEQNSIGEGIQKLGRYLQFDNNNESDDTDFSININNGSIGQYPYKNQLDRSSSEIKIFKYNETYRCGLQFQHETGKWSSPIWLGDITNDIRPTGLYNTEDIIKVITGKPHLIASDVETLITSLIEKGYRAVRPVIVYPTDNDRSCICQGVINPTVFNIGDRKDKTTFSQASWYFRPKLPYQVKEELDSSDFADFNYPDNRSENSIGGIIATKDSYKVNYQDGTYATIIQPKDAWTEFRHHYFIPHNRDTRAEIQGIEQYPNSTVATYDGSTGDYTLEEVPFIEDASHSGENYSDFSEMYAIDSALVTLNSPDIELGNISNNLLDNTKLRYIGIIPITGNTQDVDIISSTVGIINNNKEKADGFVKVLYNKPNLSRLAGRRKLADTLWKDFIDKDSLSQVEFITFPWHRKGSLNQTRVAKDGYRSAMLQNQKRSNLFYSTNSIYLKEETIQTYTPKRACLYGDDPFQYIQYPVYEDYNEVIYKGNIDSLILPDLIDRGDIKEGNRIIKKGKGYFIPRISLVTSVYRDTRNSKLSEEYYGIDPIEIKYKSTPHIVLDHGININKDSGEIDRLISPSLIGLNDDSSTFLYNTFYGSKSDYSISIDASSEIGEASNSEFSSTPGYSWLWLAELYREIPESVKFGGTSKEAIENNNWVVAGDTYSLEPKEGFNIVWREGDHFYQRYDCLKTYPYTLEDTNSVVEILSFMCETRVNLDGRYDKNRALLSNLVTTPSNFNLINNVYGQQNNFFSYNVISKQHAEIDNYLNQITWSKTKTFGETVDTWTNITLASILDLDGDKGRVEALRRLNNDLIAFQERGISQILYNDNIQISTQSGVPIEIANSGKVQGKRYLSSSVGCNNKWAICESPAGLYFIDDNIKGIYLFNGSLANLSDKLGFTSWAKENLKNLEPLSTEKHNNFVSYYDPIESEVLFLNDKECLTYSEKLGAFTSFYDYNNYTLPINMGDKTLLVGDPDKKNDLKFYEYHAGDYNDFYGCKVKENDVERYRPNYKGFSVKLVVNPEPTKDKIFNTVEFRADVFSSENKYLKDIKPFSNIQVKNEYQDTGDIVLNNTNLRKKFRIWRHTIQRDEDHKRDRIRNPWTTITLENRSPGKNKVILHDVVISYFD